MSIPQSTLRSLSLAPKDRPITLIMRHSIRYPILDDSEVFTAALTPEGIELAEQYGEVLGQEWRIRRLMSSPVGRCVDTANALARGAGLTSQVWVDERLSYPYIEAAENALPEYRQGAPWPLEVWAVMNLALCASNQMCGLDVLVTHDSNLNVLVGYLLGEIIDQTTWPEFLEGLVLWRGSDGVVAAWRGEARPLRIELADRSVLCIE